MALPVHCNETPADCDAFRARIQGLLPRTRICQAETQIVKSSREAALICQRVAFCQRSIDCHRTLTSFHSPHQVSNLSRSCRHRRQCKSEVTVESPTVNLTRLA